MCGNGITYSDEKSRDTWQCVYHACYKVFISSNTGCAKERLPPLRWLPDSAHRPQQIFTDGDTPPGTPFSYISCHHSRRTEYSALEASAEAGMAGIHACPERSGTILWQKRRHIKHDKTQESLHKQMKGSTWHQMADHSAIWYGSIDSEISPK